MGSQLRPGEAVWLLSPWLLSPVSRLLYPAGISRLRLAYSEHVLQPQLNLAGPLVAVSVRRQHLPKGRVPEGVIWTIEVRMVQQIEELSSKLQGRY